MIGCLAVVWATFIAGCRVIGETSLAMGTS
jgi:hypothetical protein